MDLRIIKVRRKINGVIKHGDPEIDTDQVHKYHQDRSNIMERRIHNKVIEQAVRTNGCNKSYKRICKLISTLENSKAAITVSNNTCVDDVF